MVRDDRIGYSIAEVVLAIGLLAFVAITLVGLFSQMVLTSSKNRDQVMAELIAEQVLERAVVEGPTSINSGSLGWGVKNQVGQVLQHEIQEPTQFFYRVDVAQLDGAAGDRGPDWTTNSPETDALDLGHHWLVEVSVGWNPDGNDLESSRVGQGLQWVKQSRTVYYQE